MESLAKTYNNTLSLKFNITQINLTKKRKIQSSNQLQVKFSSDIKLISIDNSALNQTSIMNNTENQLPNLMSNNSYSTILDLDTATSIEPTKHSKYLNHEITNNQNEQKIINTDRLPTKRNHKRGNSMMDQLKDQLWAIEMLEKVESQENNENNVFEKLIKACNGSLKMIV